MESPTYLGALQAWNAYGAEYVPVPVDEHGMQIDAFETALRAGSKFIYVLPNFQNPSGVTLSLERRTRLVELADEHGIPIIEDDPYGQLRYEGDHLPPLVLLDDRLHFPQDGAYRGNVIYLSTFSLKHALTQSIAEEVEKRFDHMQHLKQHAEASVDHAREYVESMFGLQVWSHKIYLTAIAGAHEKVGEHQHG